MDSNKSSESLNQDPDYFVPLENNKSQQSTCEKNARSTAEKISKILETEFSKEIETKKKEIFKIYETLNKACKVMHYLRFAIVTDYYNQEHLFTDEARTSQSRLHPTVNAPRTKVNLNVDCENDCFRETNKTSNTPKTKVNLNIDCKNDCFREANEANRPKRKIESISNELGSNEPKQKIPKKLVVPSYSSINGKTKIRVVVGNYSKWIPHHSREQNDATHKWTVYVIDSQKTDLGHFVSKVRFFLHPSYQPHDIIELTSSPFHLSRLGWGEFPIRVQLHFKNNRNKPVDIIHNLTLDRTYTGILTIGSETVVDIWLITTDKHVPLVEDTINENSVLSENKNNDSNVPATVEEKKNEDVSVTVKKEKEMVDFIEQNTKENFSNVIAVLSDHDYIKTNFAPIQAINDTQSKNVPSTLRNTSNMSLLKSNYGNSNCTISVEQGKIFSSKQPEHNFDKLPLSADLKSQLVSRKQKFNTEKLYINPCKFMPDKQHSKNIISLIERAKPENLLSVLKLVIRRIPLITEKSTDIYYKLLHPYACESYQVFRNFSSAKQHALERYQALHALDIMRDIQCFESSCSVYEFIIWARRYGYTPLLNFKTLNKLATTSKTINVEEISIKHDITSTISTDLNDWLLKYQNIKPSIKQVTNDSDDEIDIINVPSSAPNTLSHQRDSKTAITHAILLNHPQKYNCLNEFVCKSAEQIGIKLSNEEIIPGVSHSSASLVISKAVECLVDELTRTALSCAIDKCNVQKNFGDFQLQVDDVHKALLKRQEFDVFTNSGLGSEG